MTTHFAGDEYNLRRNYTIEEFEDTKGVIRIRILKKNIQHNGQRTKGQTTIY